MLSKTEARSPEPIPMQPIVEVADALGSALGAAAEVHLIGGATAVGAVRPIAVVKQPEVIAEAIDLRNARQEPHTGMPKHRLL